MAVSFLTETAEAAPPRAPVPAAVVSSSDEFAPPNDEAELENLPLSLEWASSLSGLHRHVDPAEQDFVSLNDEGAASPNSALCWTSIEKQNPATSDSIPTDMESSESSSKEIAKIIDDLQTETAATAPVPETVESSSDEVVPSIEVTELENLPYSLESASSSSDLKRLGNCLENLDLSESTAMVVEAWEKLQSYVYYNGQPAGTLAAVDAMADALSYNQEIDGYPFEIQSLLYFTLRCARQLLKLVREVKELLERIDKRILALSFHIQKYYRLDFTELNNIYRHKTELYSCTALNNFNVIPESIPDWVFDIVPLQGGYMIGNVTTAQIDFGWFLVAILTSLARPAQATTIMDLIEEHWEDLIGEMPLKIPYLALEGHKWRTVTGFDPENTRWSYHNGDSWPTLLWLLTAVCIKSGGPQMAKKAIELVEQRASTDGWPKSYDGTTGKYIRKQDREHQTLSISDYPVEEGNEYPTNMIQLFVRSLSGALLTLEVDVCILIKTLKVLIQHKEGIKLEEQILCYGGKILRDDKRIAEYYIRKESTIDMLLPLPGGMDAMDKGFFRLIVEGSVPQILEENDGLYSLAKQQLVKSVNRSVGEDADLNDKDGFLSQLYDDLLINLYPIPQSPIPDCPHAQIARKIMSIKSPWDLARTRLQQLVCDNISWYQMTWDATINTIDIDKMVNPLFDKLVLQRLERDVIEYLEVGNPTTLDSVISAMEGKYRMNLENQRGFIRNVVRSIGTRNMKRLRSS